MYGWFWTGAAICVGVLLFVAAMQLPDSGSELRGKLRFGLAVGLGLLPFLADGMFETTVYFIEDGTEHYARSLLGNHTHQFPNGESAALIAPTTERPAFVLVNDSGGELALHTVLYTSMNIPGLPFGTPPQLIPPMSVTRLDAGIDHFFSDVPPEERTSEGESETRYWLTESRSSGE